MEVVIALGSNLGNRAQSMLQGLRKLRAAGVQVTRHSLLYETAPAYVTDQPSYYNAAVLATTDLPPLELLKVLKQIEAEAGRDLKGGVRYGPRPLDLDIIFYGSTSVQHEKLVVPHPRWHERPFVKAPVSDLLYTRGPSANSNNEPTPSTSGRDHMSTVSLNGVSSSGSVRRWLQHARQQWRHTQHGLQHHPPVPAASAAAELGSSSCGADGPVGAGASHVGGSAAAAPAPALMGGGDIMRNVTPLPDGRALWWGGRTLLMGILNVTPDSFSDGGRFTGVGSVVAAAERMVGEGADILDIGGQSTRPGSVRVSVQDELGRVIPAIRALRRHGPTSQVLISVDTFYAEVAREAVAAGADIINDVSGGSLDPGMIPQVAALGVPYVLMHMRGDPATMQHNHHTRYDAYASSSSASSAASPSGGGGSGVVAGVAAELQAAAAAAEAAGVPAWNIILDPGLGFAKTHDGNVELLAGLRELRGHLDGPYPHAPMLLGPSRKGFLGRLIDPRRAPLLTLQPAVHQAGKQQEQQQQQGQDGFTSTTTPSMTPQVRSAQDRDVATVAACVACVAGGADIVRVHNVPLVWDGLRVADALYRKQ